MTFDFRYPQFQGTEKEQLQQMRTYIHQLVDELKWALNSIESPQGNVVVIQQSKSNANSGIGTIGMDELNDDSVQAHFNEIKPLIIKSADIVNAYYDIINKRLEGLYVASSEFGTFMEQTSQNIEATSQDVTQLFSNIQAINTDINTIGSNVGTIDSDIDALKKLLDNVNASLIDVKARIKAGLLYYDGETPVYGLEIGQTNTVNGVEVFNKFARFSAGRLSFYDNNGTEVAYISDYKLYITHAEVTGTLKLGGYLVDTSKGVTFKWVGRS